jgi:hypothetical protein
MEVHRLRVKLGIYPVSGFTLYVLEIEPFLSTIDIHLAFCGMMGILKGKL